MLPLAGVKVVEIAENLAGPYAGQILALMGAEVLKVERPEGDNARGWGPPFHGGMATTFHAMNQNKRSVTLDFRNESDFAWLVERIGQSDVVVQNMRPGALEKLGLGAEAMVAGNKRLVYCSLWALGAVGPRRMAPGFEPMVQAFSGLFALNGDPAGAPSRIGVQVLDFGTGMWAAMGILAALLRRERTGAGGIVDTSLLETAMAWMSGHWAAFAESGKHPQRDRSGNPRVVVFQAVPTADRELVVAAANDRLFAKLAAELGHPEWASDPRYATNAARAGNKEEIIGLISAIMTQQPSAHWEARFEAIGVPCAPINDMGVLHDDTQVAALGMLKPPPGMTLPLMGLPISFDGVRPPVVSGAPALGADQGIRGTASEV
jgi:crotonobetainyl-CoA:carnitine CoA-transferase CaiB-like acyl-CoA transferase